jgi:hypothetical protein
MKTYWEVDAQIHLFLASTQVGEQWSASLPGREGPQQPLVRRLDGPHNGSGRSREDKLMPLPGLDLRPLHRPTTSQLLYRLSH